MTYYYDPNKDTDEAKYYKKSFVKLVFIILYVGGVYLATTPFTVKSFIFDLVLYSIIAYAIIKVTLPKGEHISIEKEVLSWKIGLDKNRIHLNKISSWRQDTSHFIFNSHQGEEYVFPAYTIESKDKFEELIVLLKSRFS